MTSRSHQKTVAHAKKLIAQDPDLGKKKDVEVAERYKVSKTIVWRVRNQLGIPPFRGNGGGLPAHEKKRYDAIRRHMVSDGMLGEYPDFVLADLYGCSRSFVAMMREHQGIESKFKGKGSEAYDGPKPVSLLSRYFDKWPCIKERVGLTRNQWRLRND